MKKDEIVTLAYAQLSEEQLKTNQDREIYSKDLLDILKSNECEVSRNLLNLYQIKASLSVLFFF